MGSIHRAARVGDVEDVAALLSQGEDVNIISGRSGTPLMVAAQSGHLPVVRLLLSAGADIAQVHPNGSTALHHAAQKGRLSVVQELVAHGAPVNVLDSEKRTPALEAALWNHVTVVDFLLQNGAAADARDADGLTAQDWLDRGGIVRGNSDSRAEWLVYINSPGARQRAQEQMRRLMAEGLSADEWAAKHGRNTLMWSYGSYHYDDPDVKAWVARVTEVIFFPDLLHECEERWLTGADLEDARKVRARREKRAARKTADG